MRLHELIYYYYYYSRSLKEIQIRIWKINMI